MIALLTGNVAARESGRVIIDVRGVGYEVFAPNRSIDAWSGQPDAVTVHVSTQVREDAITLYGFASAADRQAFLTLISVSGIGPKLALACLDALPLESLSRAVDVDDQAMLSRIPGVGKKTAARLALELKGKLPVAFDPGKPAETGKPAERVRGPDALDLALDRFGYTRAEIEQVRLGLRRDGVADDAPIADRLRAALQLLSAGR